MSEGERSWLGRRLTGDEFVASNISRIAFCHEDVGFCDAISKRYEIQEELLAIKENHSIPLSGHLKDFLYVGSELSSIDTEIFGLEVVKGAARLVGDC
jgi:hypothetical protein